MSCKIDAIIDDSLMQTVSKLERLDKLIDEGDVQGLIYCKSKLDSLLVRMIEEFDQICEQIDGLGYDATASEVEDLREQKWAIGYDIDMVESFARKVSDLVADAGNQ